MSRVPPCTANSVRVSQRNPDNRFAALQSNHVPGLHQELYDEGLEDFRDFVNFIDGVGLSAQWTPEYDVDWLRVGDAHHEARTESREPEEVHSPSPEDIGTPFSTWLPSAPADDQVHLRSQSGTPRPQIASAQATVY